MGAGMTAAKRDARWLLTLRVGAVVAAWVWWALLPSSGWVVALAAVPVLITLIRHRSLGPAFLTVCLAVFLVSALVALWATYDRDATRPVFDHPVGWQKLWGLLLAALFFYALVTIRSPQGLRWAVGLLAGLGAAVAAGFVVTNDWAAQPALWAPITRLGESLQAAVQALLPPLPRGVLNPNIAGGVVAPLLPLSAGLALEGRRVRDPAWIALGVVAGAAMVMGLVLTTSRGAWLATAGALALAALWWLAGKVARARRLAAFGAVLGAVALVGVAVWAAVPPLRRLVLAIGPVANRLDIFSQAALLARDYPFTGSGLGTFPMVHSTYSLMIHVAVLSHAHALPLNVAVEQGLIGADALLVAWAAAAWLGLRALARAERSCPLLGAALVSLAVLVIHGLVDDALYSSRGVLFLWAPVAVVLAAAKGMDAPGNNARASSGPDSHAPVANAMEGDAPVENVPGSRAPGTDAASPGPSSPADRAADPAPPEASRPSSFVVRPSSAVQHPSSLVHHPLSIIHDPSSALLLVAAAALIIIAVLVRRPIAALWHANLGAVRQTRVELQAYDPERFGNVSLDKVRRQEDLSAALRHLQSALAFDPAQPTARTRLSQIALARRDYDAAMDHARAPWEAGYRDRVTRLVLGDALVARGQVEQAAQTVAGLERARTRLQGQAYFYQRHGDWQRAAYAWRTLAALDPDDDAARANAARAEEKAKEQ